MEAAAPAGNGEAENVVLLTLEQQAAKFVGLTYESIGPREGCRLPRQIAQESQSYLSVRNSILMMWFDNPNVYLPFEFVEKKCDKGSPELRRAVYDFLNHYGYINAGVLKNHPGFSPEGVKNPRKKRIIVIGAGMSGITAARQLKALGHEVVVLEGRGRIGGRVNTDYKTFESPVDLGASIITGLIGNPLGVVTRQIDTKLHTINLKCPLFSCNGKEIPADSDDIIWNKYNRILDATDAERKRLKSGDPSSLAGMDLLSTMRKMQSNEDIDDLDVENIINWHITNLEYGCATSLSNLSLEHWDQDDPYAFDGQHLFLKDGYTSVVKKLAEGLDIHLNCKVKQILYRDEKGVKIEVASEGTDMPKVFEGDLALVTVSLGVLKSGMIKFNPPLPLWKQAAINRLGFGLINKLVLEFREEDIFWKSTDMFGHVKDIPERRGNNYMFWNLKNVTGKPILVSIFAGEAAHAFEKQSKESLVKEAMVYLRRIYGEEIKDPVRTHKTAWKSDPFAQGTYSYVKVGASGDDYDALARSVRDRIFFAGEATCRLYPATVPGAHASGLFAAGQIMDACNPIKHEFANIKLIRTQVMARRRKRGFREARQKLQFTGSDRIRRKLDSMAMDLMDGIFGRPEKKEKAVPRSLLANIKGIRSQFKLPTPKKDDKNDFLPSITTFQGDSPIYESKDVLDLTESVVDKHRKRLRHELKNQQRLKKKVKRELQKKQKKKMKHAKDRSVKELEHYAKRYISKLLDKYVKNYKLSSETGSAISEKILSKVVKDWSGKDRGNLSIKTWMSEKRKRSIKECISKYCKKSRQESKGK